jgi:hypothetical protein
MLIDDGVSDDASHIRHSAVPTGTCPCQQVT